MKEKGRMQPNNPEAERSVLSSMLLAEECMLEGLDTLVEEDFYDPANRMVFSAMKRVFEAGYAVDYVTVTEHLDNDKSINCAEYLADLTGSVPTTANFKYYRDIVKEKSRLRGVISIGLEMAQDAFDEKRSSEELLDAAGNSIYKMAVSGNQESLTHIRDASGRFMEKIKRVMESDDGMLGVPTGFPRLDRMTRGLQGGQVIVVAARPAVGKTSFALNIVENIGIRKKIPCLMFALEMSPEELSGRIISSWSGVDSQRIRSGNLGLEDVEKMNEGIKAVSDSPIYMEANTAITVSGMMATARKLMSKEKLGLIVIDYLQLMNSAKKYDSAQYEVAGISRAVKKMAMELDVPVILVSQLNRSNEKGSKKIRKPMMSDLRDSGAIEQDADVIILLHRDEYYDKDNIEVMGKAEIIVEKQRNGPTGTIDALFKSELTRFEEIDMRNEEPVFK